MIPNMTNERMQAFIATITEQVRVLLNERESDILRAWNENIEEAQENEKNFPPLKIGISATVDLEGAKIESAIRFTAVYQSSISTALPDPNQLELPAIAEAAMGKKLERDINKGIDKMKKSLGPGESVTISTPDGKSATIRGK